MEELVTHCRIPQLQPLGRELGPQSVRAESAAGRGEREQEARERERAAGSGYPAHRRVLPVDVHVPGTASENPAGRP